MGRHATSTGRRGQEIVPETQWDRVISGCRKYESTKISRERKKRAMKAICKNNHFAPMSLKDKVIANRKLK